MRRGTSVRIKISGTLLFLTLVFVFGPGLNSNATSENFSIMKVFGNGLMKRGTPNIGIGIIDASGLTDTRLGAVFIKNAHGH